MENTGEGEKGRNKIMKGNEDREVEQDSVGMLIEY